MYGNESISRIRYNGGPWGLKSEQTGGACIECGQCLELCPQHIAIPEWLKKVHAELAS
jgi:predicted aldo/keto reductase-like oxidoreductase